MKALFYLSFFGFIVFAEVITAHAQQSTVAQPPAYTAISRTQNSTVWRRAVCEEDAAGRLSTNSESYVELASGLNYLDAAGKYEPSSDEIDILSDGTASATNAPCKVYFPANIYDGVIQLITSAGLRLRSQPLGLSYDDGTNTVLVASLTNSFGELVGQNKIVYPNAFNGIDADLVYTFRKSGLEQDLVFREQPPTPEAFGLSAANTRLQLLTEFFDPPKPGLCAGAFDREDGLQDTTLSFGSLKMIHGRAFLSGDSRNRRRQASVYKSWLNVGSRTFLVEQLPYARIIPQLATLPNLPAVSMNSKLHKPSSKIIFPPQHLARTETNMIQIAMASPIRKPGVVLDYVTVASSATNFVFRADTTYFVSGEYWLYGTTVFEGGSIIKVNSSAELGVDIIDQGGTVQCETASYRPCVFTSWNDNSVGEAISGSSGSPNYQDADYCLTLYSTNTTLSNCRFCYCEAGIDQYAPSSEYALNLRDCQFLNVATPVYFGDQVGLYNVLIGYSTNESAEIISNREAEVYVGESLVAENVTADSGYSFVGPAYPGPILALTNCLVTDQMLTNSSRFVPTLITNDVAWVPSPTAPIYQTVGGGNYYLANNSPYRGAGTADIDPVLLADLGQKTTWPPLAYLQTNISSLGTLTPDVPRDTNSDPDIGYHYDPLDYVFAGCSQSGSLAFTAGTAVGWFYDSDPASGFRDAIALHDAANLSFNGTATEPCYFSRYSMVQEDGNGNWFDNNDGFLGAITFDGSSTNQEPELTCNFTKWTSDINANTLRDDWAYGAGGFQNCEFYGGQISLYNAQSLDFTNCLFFRGLTCFWDQDYALSFALENCTFYGGCFIPCRYSYDGGISSSFWLIENCSFDGTAFNWADSLDANPANTLMNYNAYNTNNLIWQTYPYFSPTYGTNEIVGSKDVMVTNYNWQSSWFGNFYLPPDSPLIDAGSTTADQLGLYHFTTQTNQTVEGDSIVDIGYHYVATDAYGNPLDSNGDGIPDYLEDSSGKGILGPQIILTAPSQGTFYTEPATIPIQAMVSDWSGIVTNVEFLQSNGVQGAVGVVGIPSAPYSYSWPIVAAGQYGVSGVAQDNSGLSATSAVVAVTVTNLCGY